MVDGFNELHHRACAEGVAGVADGTGLVDVEDVGEHAEEVLSLGLVLGYVMEFTSFVDFQDCIVYHAQFP